MSAYEKKRQENIRKNEALLQSLGIRSNELLQATRFGFMSGGFGVRRLCYGCGCFLCGYCMWMLCVGVTWRGSVNVNERVCVMSVSVRVCEGVSTV